MKTVQCLMFPLLAVGADIRRPSVFDGLYSYEKVMLVCGVVLFAILVVLLVIFAVQKRKLTQLMAFFLLPIIMIGFPAVQKIAFDKESVKLDPQADNLRQNPSNPMAQKALGVCPSNWFNQPSFCFFWL